jgi:hypothetical protein
MKNWKLYKLYLELGIRTIGLLMGTLCSSIFLFFLWNQLENSSWQQITKNFNLENLAVATLFYIIPLIISIFILVATRKFKELNQLIEENKKL